MGAERQPTIPAPPVDEIPGFKHLRPVWNGLMLAFAFYFVRLAKPPSEEQVSVVFAVGAVSVSAALTLAVFWARSLLFSPTKLVGSSRRIHPKDASAFWESVAGFIAMGYFILWGLSESVGLIGFFAVSVTGNSILGGSLLFLGVGLMLVNNPTKENLLRILKNVDAARGHL